MWTIPPIGQGPVDRVAAVQLDQIGAGQDAAVEFRAKLRLDHGQRVARHARHVSLNAAFLRQPFEDRTQLAGRRFVDLAFGTEIALRHVAQPHDPVVDALPAHIASRRHIRDGVSQDFAKIVGPVVIRVRLENGSGSASFSGVTGAGGS